MALQIPREFGLFVSSPRNVFFVLLSVSNFYVGAQELATAEVQLWGVICLFVFMVQGGGIFLASLSPGRHQRRVYREVVLAAEIVCR